MSIVKAIYAVKPRYFHSVDNYNTSITIKYNGKEYKGLSYIHPDDKDFFSKKVGKNIALSRARTAAMKAELKREKDEHKILSGFYFTIGNSVKVTDYQVSDFEKQFLKLLNRMEKNIKNLQVAIEREEDRLDKYLQGQAKAIESVKRFRAKQDTSN